MQVYNTSKLSEKEEQDIIEQADRNGWEWYFDLGDDEDNNVVNMLIVYEEE